MIEFKILLEIDIRPVNIKQIQILKLHQLQYFFHLFLHRLMLCIHYFGSNKQLFSLHSAFLNHCFYCFSQRNLVVIKTSSINVLAITQLQTFAQQFSQNQLVSEFICTESQQRQYLFVRQYLEGWAFLFFSLFFCHVNSYIFSVEGILLKLCLISSIRIYYKYKKIILSNCHRFC